MGSRRNVGWYQRTNAIKYYAKRIYNYIQSYIQNTK